MAALEQTIGVFGEEMLLWICVLRQSPQRPAAEHVYRQANHLLDELKGSQAAQALPIQAVDDGMFAIAALLDELAMSLPDLRPLWASHPLQATRWMTNDAGQEVFQRLDRVRAGPRTIVATYLVVLGMGFQGRHGLPGADKYALVQIRRDLALQMGIDADRDWKAGVLRPSREDEASSLAPKEAWHRQMWVGRVIAAFLLLGGVGGIVGLVYRIALQRGLHR